MPLLYFIPAFASAALRTVVDELTSKINDLGGEWKSTGAPGGDVVEAHTDNYQLLHSDWPSYDTSSMALGYALDYSKSSALPADPSITSGKN